MTRIARLVFLIVLSTSTSYGTIWYIRPDGGTRHSANARHGQCDGQADAPYSGKGSNQRCAFNDYRYLYSDGTYNNKAWLISGGDTVIIRGGPWRVGQNGANPRDSFGNDPGDPYGAFNPTIPSGTPAQHTRFLGENYAQCTAKTQLFGGYAVAAVLSLKGAQYVDVQCLEITDHAQCTRVGAAAYPARCNSSYPLSDYAGSGILTDTHTHDILLQDLDIHGLTSRAIIGPIGGLITANRVRLAYNGAARWDFDDGNGTPSMNGQVNASYLTVEWNGCNEEYPITHAYPAVSCYDDNSGGYGDGIGTPDTPLDLTCDHCTFRYNTQDGLDLLHVTGSSITVTNSLAVGNMGQQYKLGPMANVVLRNSVAIANCRRMAAPFAGAPSTYNGYLSDFCRAEDGIALNLAENGSVSFENNSFAGYVATMFDVGCPPENCRRSKIVFRNNVVLGYSNPAYNSGLPPGLFYFGQGASAANFTARNNNVYFGTRDLRCPTGYAGEKCADPHFSVQPTFRAEEDLDKIDFHPSAGSPLIHAGTAIPEIPTDYAGAVRDPQAYDVGAFKR